MDLHTPMSLRHGMDLRENRDGGYGAHNMWGLGNGWPQRRQMPFGDDPSFLKDYWRKKKKKETNPIWHYVPASYQEVGAVEESLPKVPSLKSLLEDPAMKQHLEVIKQERELAKERKRKRAEERRHKWNMFFCCFTCMPEEDASEKDEAHQTNAK